MKLRVIFTECIQDGTSHFSQTFWTKDIPVPPELAGHFGEYRKSVVGVEVLPEENGAASLEKAGGAE